LIQVRRVSEKDFARWRELFDGYNRFYGRIPDDELSVFTWKRILDPSSPVKAIVAVTKDSIVGIANYLTHESTTSRQLVCLMQDLFVDEAARGTGAARALIEWLVEETKARGWQRLYWHTRENDYRARALYDRVCGAPSGFIRYVIDPRG
jgi:GNAT superfamily N-acetyltransferase